MGSELSARTIYALAEVITGGSASSPEPSIGLYRSGYEIEKFFNGLGYDVSLAGRSRLPFTEDTLMGISRQADGLARVQMVIEAAVDPRDFIGQKEKLQNVLEYLNEHLQYDGLRLEKVGLHYRLKPFEPSLEPESVAPSQYEYDVALSYASEDRAYVEEVAEILKRSGVCVFYDKYHEAEMWGKDLHEHLDAVFRQRSRYCVIFISASYAQKVWTSQERRSAFARAVEDASEYVLPARFDDTEIVGLQPTIAHIDLRHKAPEELAELIEAKLSGRT